VKKNSVKIGFFGGCFNPPTKAHINLAQKALKECDLNKVIFVPVGDFYDKEQLVSGKHRYNMLSISCKDLENIEVTDLELNIKQKLYASDAKDRIFIIKNDTYNKYSSSKFRNMAKQKDIYDKEIVSDKVLDYIIENKLYIIY